VARSCSLGCAHCRAYSDMERAVYLKRGGERRKKKSRGKKTGNKFTEKEWRALSHSCLKKKKVHEENFRGEATKRVTKDSPVACITVLFTVAQKGRGKSHGGQLRVVESQTQLGRRSTGDGQEESWGTQSERRSKQRTDNWGGDHPTRAKGKLQTRI